MTKIAFIYHSADLDGLCSAAIAKIHYGKNSDVDYIGWNYGDDIPDLNDYDIVYLADLSFPASVMIDLHTKLGSDFIWIDHHKSAIDLMNAMYKPINGIQRTDKSACRLVWEFFYGNTEEPLIVRFLGLYDNFDHKGLHNEWDILYYQLAARIKYVDYEELAYDISTRGNGDVEFNQDIRAGRMIYLHEKQRFEKAYKNRIYVPISIGTDKLMFAAINGNRMNPANFEIDYVADGFDGVISFSIMGDGITASIYSNLPQVDVSKIATKLGGGGHANASGFKIRRDTESEMNIFTTLLDRVGTLTMDQLLILA